MSEHKAIISVRGVSKHFPGVNALQDLSLDVLQGEVLGLVGENGAGKSTLVKILAGIYRKDGGEILIDGRRAVISNPLEAQNHGMSFIFQERNLAPFLTVQENIFAGRQPRSRLGFINWKRLSAQTRDLLNALKVDLEPETLVNALPVAKQQITEIARALSFDSKVIVIDEPTASISDEDARTLFGIIRELKRKGVTTVFISHRLKEVISITDRIAVLRDGRLVGVRETARTSQDEIIRLMVGRDIHAEADEVKAPPSTRIVLGVRNLRCPGAFQEINFDLHAGEILGFAGLVGAKRTEVLRALFGFLPGASGDIFIDGQKAACASPIEAMQQGIGYLSEDRKGEGIFPFMSVSKNITVASLRDFARLGFLDQKGEKAKSRELVNALDIKAPHVDTLLLSLSGGNQQKTILARELLRKPRILLLDEPTVGIDVGAKFEIYNILKRLASEGVGIVFVSSELPELLRLCHRIIVMCQGRITGEFNAGEADQEQIMVRATQFIQPGAP